jgi:hypothetical protein
MDPRCHRGRQGINLRRTKMVSFQSPQSRGRNRGSTTIHVLLPATASVNVNGSATVTARRNRKHSPQNLSGLASFPPLPESLSKAPPPRRNRAGILPRTGPLSLQGPHPSHTMENSNAGLRYTRLPTTRCPLRSKHKHLSPGPRRMFPYSTRRNVIHRRDPPYPPIPLGSALCIVNATYPILQPTERLSHRKQNSRKH